VTLCTVGTRPLMLVTWMEGYLGVLREKGYTIPRYLDGLAGVQLNGVRYTAVVCGTERSD
jgi:hypothetical protein